jgi:excisionase family DNA binding protein
MKELKPTKKSEFLSNFLNINELSNLLELSVSNLYKLTSQKRIPHIKLGKKLLFEKGEIMIWLKNKKVEAK